MATLRILLASASIASMATAALNVDLESPGKSQSHNLGTYLGFEWTR